MSNTRDSLGEQATLDGLIAHTLTSLEEDGVTNLPLNALYKNTGLTNVNFPNLLTLTNNIFYDCPNLTTVDVGEQCTSITGHPFSGCSKMDTLILRNTNNICTVSNDSFKSTKISIGFGGIYVPDALLSAYKSATNWNTMADNIFPLSEYPKSKFDTISDNWSTIIANCNAGTIDNYNIGDTKILDLSETQQIFMQIVAKNTDKLTDNTGTASLTWLCKNLYNTMYMNNSNTNSGGWGASKMRSYLQETVFAYLPAELQNSIKAVKKTWYDSTTKTTQVSNDTIWIPSTYEMFTESGAANYVVETDEEDNVLYTIFNNNIKRIKRDINGTPVYYWLRSAYKDANNTFYCVDNNGGRGAYGASYSRGIVFGFCT